MTDLDRIGRYETVGLLGRGGMGSVYLARDPLIDRQLAIKVLDSEFDAAARDRFAREARAAGRLHHPNIVTIFDVGEHRGLPFIAMEYVPGETLAALIRHGRLALTEKLRLLEDACAGLAYAHRASIVHLDVKPANLIRHDSGVLKILDFGIARVASDATQTRQIAGTLRYMAPEQVIGHAVDRRTDVFAMGCVLYEILAGEPAFKGTVGDLLARVANPPPPPLLSEIVPDMHPELVRMTQRAMAHNPNERYDDLEVVREELSALRHQLGEPDTLSSAPRAIPSGSTQATVLLPETATSVRRRRRGIWAAASIAVVGAALAAAQLMRTTEEAAPSRDSAPKTTEIAQPPPANTPTPPPVEAPRVEEREPKPLPTPRTADAGGATDQRPPQSTAGRQAKPKETRTTDVVTTPQQPATSTEPTPVPPPAPAPSTESERSLPDPPAAEPSRPPVAAAPSAETAIANAMKAYEAAYDARDAAALRRIAPALSAEQHEAISHTFADAISYDLEMKVLAIEVSDGTATARCMVTHSFVPRIGSATRTSPREALFYLRQTANGWVITQIDR